MGFEGAPIDPDDWLPPASLVPFAELSQQAKNGFEMAKTRERNIPILDDSDLAIALPVISDEENAIFGLEKIRPFNNPEANMEIYNTGTKVCSQASCYVKARCASDLST